MRLIDADVLLNQLEDWRGDKEDLDMEDGHDVAYYSAMSRAMRFTKCAPAIDAVPVVRCPDCSWRTNSSFCRRHGHYVRDDFFCAYGTTGDVRGCRPAKKIEKKAEERCLATGGPCTRCTPGPCDHRKTVIADDSGQ